MRHFIESEKLTDVLWNSTHGKVFEIRHWLILEMIETFNNLTIPKLWDWSKATFVIGNVMIDYLPIMFWKWWFSYSSKKLLDARSAVT